MSSVLEEVDVEQQLEDQEGQDSPVIKINTEVIEDDDKNSKFKVGDLVIDMLNFKSDKEAFTFKIDQITRKLDEILKDFSK